MALRFAESTIPAVNVAAVPQRSPLRYPGGKTWLIPHIREWLSYGSPHPLLIEPFAGGGIVSLTAVMEGLAHRALMVDIDRDVAAFWRAALLHNDEMVRLIGEFEPSRDTVNEVAQAAPNCVLEHGFRTLVLNRTRRGGVLAPGAALTRNGENGNGVSSRWYPETLQRRLGEIKAARDRLSFCEGDGVQLLEDLVIHRPGACVFIDAPYTAGGKRAGSRLYLHNDVDHDRIFQIIASSNANVLMTYDCSDEVLRLVEKHRFHAVTVNMKNGHHARIPELVITRDRLFV